MLFYLVANCVPQFDYKTTHFRIARRNSRRFLATVDDFLSPTRQVHPFTLFVGYLIVNPILRHLEASLAQHLGIIAAKLAHVVVLAKETLTFLGVGDARILESVDFWIDRYQQNGPATRLQDAFDFGEGLVGVADVFKHMVADDHIVGVARLDDGGHVEVKVGDGRIEVGSGVIEVLQGSETLQERLLGREMQDFQWCGKEIRLLLQIKPQQTMPFERQTFGTQAIVHRLAITVGQEFPEMTAANGAFHLVAQIKRTNQNTKQIAQFDEPLAGKNFREQGDEFFH